MARSLTGRFGWPLADQALNAGTNFALLVFVARATSSEDLGRFAVAYAIYGLALALVQGIVGETFLVLVRGQSSSDLRTSASAAIGAASLLAGGCSAVLIVVQAGFDVPQTATIVAAALPGLLVQDACRYIALGTDRSRLAALNDADWAGLQLAGFTLVVLEVLPSTVATLTLIWAVSGSLCGAIGVWQLRASVQVRRGAQWLARHRAMAASYGGEATAFAASVQLTTLVVAATVTLADAGALRLVQAVFGPFAVVVVMLRIIAIRDANDRLDQRGRRGLLPLLGKQSALGAGLGAGLTVALLCLPEDIGTAMLGATWTAAAGLVPWVGLQRSLNGASVGVLAGLRVLRLVRIGLLTRLFAASITTVGGVAGTATYGVHGCVVGLALGSGVGLLAMVMGLRAGWSNLGSADRPTSFSPRAE